MTAKKLANMTGLLVVLASLTATAALGHEPSMADAQIQNREANWATLETDALRASEFWRMRDAYQARIERDRSTDRQRYVQQFAYRGAVQPCLVAAIRSALYQQAASPAVRELLFSRVPKLEAQQFLSTNVLFEVIRSDGKLAPLPAALLDDSPSSPLYQARKTFGSAWISVRERVLEGEAVSRNDVRRLQEALANWKSDAADVLADDTAMARVHALRYLTKLQAVIDTVQDSARCEQLRQFLGSDEAGFGGGTLGELADHILGNRLGVTPGSRAQEYLARLAAGLSQGLDTQIAACNLRITQAAADSPARDAAVKQRLAGGQSSVRHSYSPPSSVLQWYYWSRTYTVPRFSYSYTTRSYSVPHVIRIR